LAGGTGATFAMAVTWIRSNKPDAPMTLNGVLAGLVSITAGCANLTPVFAILTGGIAGILVVFALEFIDRYVDDAVGAVSVHGVCGAWGTLAAGLFNSGDMFNMSIVSVQLLGIGAAFLWTFPVSLLVFTLLRKTIGLRVNGLLEELGLDIHEHDSRAYPEFLQPEDLVPTAA
jgi:ammonium transporter, Amt family